MVRAHRDGLRPWFRGNIVPVENIDGVGTAAGMQGVLTLASTGSGMADLFADFCRKHLCQESWDFIVDATRYENMAVRNNVTFWFIYLVYIRIAGCDNLWSTSWLRSDNLVHQGWTEQGPTVSTSVLYQISANIVVGGNSCPAVAPPFVSQPGIE